MLDRRPAGQHVLCVMRAGVVQRRLQIVNISWGSKPSDAVGMHVAAWVLGESLMHLATVWSPPEVRALLRGCRHGSLAALSCILRAAARAAQLTIHCMRCCAARRHRFKSPPTCISQSLMFLGRQTNANHYSLMWQCFSHSMDVAV